MIRALWHRMLLHKVLPPLQDDPSWMCLTCRTEWWPR